MKKTDMPRVLVLDDDDELRDLLGEVLTRAGFAVTLVASGAALWRSLDAVPPDVCVLDWMLRGEDGLALARELVRRPGRPPVLMLSARGSLDERLDGLAVVDDFLSKPFDARELVARLKALLRRQDKGEGQLVFGPFVMDAASHELCREGVPVALTAGEWRLLWHLVQQPERVFSRAQLQVVLHEQGSEQVSERAVDVRLSRLRRKLGEEGLIETVWGEGYRLVLPAGWR